jgi:hypothetical protein
MELREEALRQANTEREETSRILADLVNEFREERRQSAATQQALLETIVHLTQQGNGRTEAYSGD